MSTESQPSIVVVDYGAGNLRSAVRALANIGAAPVPTSDPDVVRRASVVVFPGVGATRDTMDTLQRTGLGAAVREVIAAGTPLLGICVGMQVLCAQSEEFGTHDCLGVVGGVVRRLPDELKVPQIGWNQLCYQQGSADHPLFQNIPDATDFYFVHSYYCDLSTPGIIAGTTDYGLTFPSALLRDNLAAVQFHPEKSGRYGLQLLTNFVRWATS